MSISFPSPHIYQSLAQHIVRQGKKWWRRRGTVPSRRVVRTAQYNGGGGGDRTRVPPCFHESFYVYSRLFGVSRQPPSVDRVRMELDENLFNSERARRGPERFGIGDQLLDVSDKPPQPGQPLLGCQCEVTFGT